ncbi:MAG: hypothetical protein AB1861_17095 [Cyanobacteriota bacterium]
MKLLTRRKAFSVLGERIPQLLVGMASVSLLSYLSKKTFSFERQVSGQGLEILNESGDFLDEVSRLKKLALPKKSNLYQPPTDNDLKDFNLLANALIFLDIKGTLKKANALNYELVRFIDTPSKQILYGLREKHVRDRPLRGWGSYFVNASYNANALVEVPHIIFDRFSEEIGAKAFLMSAARGFLITGAHRNANGTGTADVCNPINSIFQEVHKAWILSRNKTWQIHGFSISTKSKFPDNTQSVLSDGQGRISSEVLDLSLRMKKRGFQSHVYNELSASAPLNRRLNQGVAGKTFSHLGGTHNVQGIYCHSVGTAFTHIELDKSVRYKATNRDVIARVIADSIQGVS